MTRTRLTLCLGLLLAVLIAPVAGASDLWFHVTVHEGADDANVTINLPLTLVESALAMIDVDELDNGMVQLEGTDLSAAELRQLWQELEATPDAEFVTVESADETVRVFKEAGYLVVRAEALTDRGSDVHMRIPSAVVAALLDGADENQLNVGAALRALAAEGEGELATITDDETRVRVWIDSRPESR